MELQIIGRRTCATCRKAVALLNERGIPFTFRDYVEQPLSEAELRELLDQLGAKPADVLRRNDPAYRELGLTGAEPDDALIRHMVEHPGLLQRPIGVHGGRVVLGRPVEKLLDLA